MSALRGTSYALPLSLLLWLLVAGALYYANAQGAIWIPEQGGRLLCRWEKIDGKYTKMKCRRVRRIRRRHQ